MPSREEAEAAIDKMEKDAIKAAIEGDADRARLLKEQAEVGKHVLKGRHD